MRCSRVQRWLSAYGDGELDAQRREAVEQHLAHCHHCAAALERLKGPWAMLVEVDPVPPLPTGLWHRILRQLEDHERHPWYRTYRDGLRRAACVAACVILGFAAGVLLSWQTPGTVRTSPRPVLSEKRLVAEAFDSTIVGPVHNEGGLLRCVPR